MNINTILIIITLAIISLIVALLYIKSKREFQTADQTEQLSFERLLEKVKYSLADLIKDENYIGIEDEEFEAMYKRKARIQEAMQDCVHGIDSAKLIVQDLIRSIINDLLKTESNILKVYDFHSRNLEPRIKFEILMYFYKKEFGKDALAEMINEYKLARERYHIEDKTQPSYAITIEDINTIYKDKNFHLDYHIMLDILSILIFQRYKGFGVIDTLREMNINGFNCGTSGSILSNLTSNDDKKPEAPRSVWLYFNGKYIHLRFLSFNTEEELRRVVQLLCRYNNPGPLTEKRGYMVNTMYDKSRVLAMRPPASEYWAVFVRKFTLTDSSLFALIDKPYVNNAHLAIYLVMYLMLGQITCAFTGRQGAGKTVMMTAAVKYIDPRYTIRVLEMAPEMYLRELYPERNILSVQETEFVTASELQDALKKSDAAVSIVGEVATDAIAARMIQMGQVASIFTIFSHHANTAEHLVYAIRNSLVNAGGFSGNMLTAEQQVIDVIKVDIHLNYTTDGRRYIERVSEIIQLDESVPYPEYDTEEPVHSMNEITKEYYNRRTDRKSFTTRDIMKYNAETNTYEACEWFSTGLTQRMLDAMPLDKVDNFKTFIMDNWRL